MTFRGSAIRHNNSIRPGCVRGANNGAKIVRILYAIQDNQQLRPGQHLIQLHIMVRSAKCHHALMGGTVGCAIQRLARLKTQRDR